MTPRQQVILVAAVLALAGAVDFYQRVYVPRTPSARDTDLDAATLPAVPLPLAAARKRMQSWLPEPMAASQSDLPDAMNVPQDPAARLPDRADMAGWRFVLRGVFDVDAGPRFAVLELTSIENGEIERHDLTAGQIIKGVRVERILRHSVSLSDGEEPIELALFVDPRNNLVPANEQDE